MGARKIQHATRQSSQQALRASSARVTLVYETTSGPRVPSCHVPEAVLEFCCAGSRYIEPDHTHRCRLLAPLAMSSCRSFAVLCLSVLLPAVVICAGDPLPAAPAMAPTAVPTAVIDAPEVVERSPDTYTLDAYVWRDSQPLVVSGDQQALLVRLPTTGADYTCMQAINHSALRRPDYQTTHRL